MAGAGGQRLDAGRDPVEAALWLARAFAAGRRLVVVAPGAADHAHHVAVEFVHPVIAGTRPLPAVAADSLAEALDQSTADDVLLMIGGDVTSCPDAPSLDAASVDAPSTGGQAPGPDLTIAGGAGVEDDVETVRTYHLLWELVHVALEHPGLVGGEGSGGDDTGFLYPFLDGAESDEAALRTSLAGSAAAKVDESDRLVAGTLAAMTTAMAAATGAVSDAVAAGRRIHVAGNGGSATDAARLARRLRSVGVAATSLAADYAVVTALANDVGVDRVFARQVEALAAPGDVLIGLSTSGSSPNLLAAFAEADRRGLVTVAVSGYGGGTLAVDDSAHHLLVVESTSVHRIQEAQAALLARLVDAVAARPIPATITR
jgi:D-sedoheptulose 7-phosphate isomerase